MPEKRGSTTNEDTVLAALLAEHSTYRVTIERIDAESGVRVPNITPGVYILRDDQDMAIMTSRLAVRVEVTDR